MVASCPLVWIEWEDSTQPQGRWQWLSEFQLPKAVRCVSVGFLIRDTPEVKTLAPNLGNVDCPDGLQASGLITIPARGIVGIKPLTERSRKNACEGVKLGRTPRAETFALAAGSKRPAAGIRRKRQAP